ncbi:MAG: hypothetical protein AAF581_18250 [Planctomycetota bacterium]
MSPIGMLRTYAKRRAAVVLFLTASALASAGCAIPRQDVRVLKGRHFRLVCNYEAGNEIKQALDAVEAVWPRAAELYGFEPDTHGELWSVHLHRDNDSYWSVERELAQGRLRRNLAFAHEATMTAHVALQPPLSDEALAVAGLPSQTVRLLVHEAAHLVRFAQTRGPRTPRWLVDGAASWLDEKVTNQLGLHENIEEDPHFSTCILRVRALLRSGGLPSVVNILRDELQHLEFYERYSLRWLFFRFLVEGKHAPMFRSLIAQPRLRGDSRAFNDVLMDGARPIYSASELNAVNDDFRSYVVRLVPAWHEQRRSLGVGKKEWLQAAFDHAAIAWRRQEAGGTYTVSGNLTILEGGREQASVLLGRCDGGFVSVAMGRRQVAVYEYARGDGSWTAHATVDCQSALRGQTLSCSIVVDNGSLLVSIDHVKMLECELDGDRLVGPWGLGVAGNGAVLWRLTEAPGLPIAVTK